VSVIAAITPQIHFIERYCPAGETPYNEQPDREFLIKPHPGVATRMSRRQKSRLLPPETKLLSAKAPQATFAK
jgi:hypothetical protein